MSRQAGCAPRLRLALCGATVAVAACTPPPGRTTPVLHSGAAARFDTAERLLAAVARHNDHYRTLRATHRVVLEIATEDGRREHHACTGVVAVQRPDRLRLVALGAVGMKLFDLLYVAGEARAVSIAPQLARGQLLPQILRSVAGDLRAIYRLAPPLPRDRLQLEASYSARGHAPLFEVTAYREGRQVQQLVVFAASLAVARAEEPLPGGETRTVTYGDYERRGELLVPRSILVAREGAISYWLSIQVEQLEIDPPLDAQLFASS